MAARIRAVLRRSAGASRHLFALGAVEVDLDRHEVRRDGATIHLTAKEFKLLRQLIACAGEVVTHRRLLQAVWGAEYGDEVEYLRVFINQLRKKLEPNPTKPKYLITEPAIGYRLTVP
jgi:two-component system KDP operon response regulator KdpE